MQNLYVEHKPISVADLALKMQQNKLKYRSELYDSADVVIDGYIEALVLNCYPHNILVEADENGLWIAKTGAGELHTIDDYINHDGIATFYTEGTKLKYSQLPAVNWNKLNDTVIYVTIISPSNTQFIKDLLIKHYRHCFLI